jgi:hypothetical protein
LKITPVLCHRSERGQALIHDPPERPDGLGLVVKKILEKARSVELDWIGVALAIFTVGAYPILGFPSIEDLEQAAKVK